MEIIIAAIIAAVPATIAALRAHTCTREIRRVKSMLNAHLTDMTAHNPSHRLRSIRQRKEGE